MQAESFSATFNAALTKKGLSLVRLETMLRARGVDVSVSTLSRWRTGERMPSRRLLDTLAALEDALDLPDNALAKFVAARSPHVGSVPPQVQDADSARVLQRLSDVRPADYRTLSIEEVIVIDENLRIERIEEQHIIQCVHGTIRKMGHLPPYAIGPEFSIDVTAGGQIDDTWVDDTTGIHGCGIVLDRPLQHGETAIVELTVHHPHELQRHAVAIRRKLRSFVQWYSFIDGHEPDWFEEREVLTTGETRLTGQERPSSVLRVHTTTEPSDYEARWGMIDDL